MASTNSGSDSSPKSPTSSSSSSEEEEDHNSTPTVHPGSPSNAHQSSDESTTSDGVLVELPHNPDHDARGMQGDPDGGVLVNIDGSMQEGREDLFLDAPEDLSSSRSSALDESMAVIDYGETSVESPGSRSRSGDDELARVRDRLDETIAQCRKYKEEREVFGKEVSSLRQQLREISYQQSLTGTTEESVEHAPWMGREGGEDEVFTSPTPLHSMVGDCSKMLSHLKSTLNGQVNSVDTIGGLSAGLTTKEKELEDLNLKLMESNVCQDVTISYLGSIRENWSQSLKESSDEVNKRLLSLLETAVGQGRLLVDSFDDGVSLIEKKTLSLIQNYKQLVSETQQFKQFLAEMRPELLTSDENEFSFVYSIARDELFESKRKETALLEKTSILEDEIRRMAEVVNKMKEGLEAAQAETNKTKVDLEHAENKLASAREKLSIAVTKGKSLVQHRDALKQSLAEKTSELEKSALELQHQSSTLKASEIRIEELNQLLAEKTNELDKCLLELKDLSTVLESTKISGLEKTSDLEKCLLELQQKSEALANAEAHAEVLEQSLTEKIGDLDKCLLELKQTSYALENSEANNEEINKLLGEKNIEFEKCMVELQQKSDELENSGVIAAELRHTLTEKTIELENCLQTLQQIQISENIIEEVKLALAEKTNEHEKCLLQWQQKSDALEATEASAVELRQSLAAKTLELENCFQKLQDMQASESIIEELKMSVAEKANDLEKCRLELQKKADALDATEVSAEELRQMLGEKTTELENCLQQLQQVHNSESIVEELRTSLAEKTNELEKCQLELQEKSDTLQTTITTSCQLIESQNSLNSLRESISEKDRILQEIEELTQHVESPEDLLSMAVVDRVRWFIDQNLKVGRSLVDSSRIKEALSPIALPENVSSTELESQIYWLVKSFTQAKEVILKLEEEIAGAKLSLESHESELFETHKEIDRLATSLFEVKHEKDFVQEAHEILKTKYKTVAQKLSLISLETGGMVKELTETSMSSLGDQSSLEADLPIAECIDTIGKSINVLLTERGQFEEIKSLLYVKYQEQRLCENILEEDIFGQSKVHALSAELRRASEEVTTLKSEKEAMQKELERVEERSSLIREKLSMAVKKGKGLVQEREGFKHALDEKSSEIEKLKQELRLQESAIDEYKKKIESLSALPEHIQKLESEIVSLKDLREQSGKLVQESNNMLQALVESIEEVILPTDKVFEKPVEKVFWIAEHIHESEVYRARLQQELEEVKVEATLQVTKLNDAFATVKSLEDELAKIETHTYSVTQEKEDLQLAKVTIAQELEKLKEESSLQANKLEDAYATIRSLEDELGSKNIEELEKLKEEASQLQEAYATIKSLEDAVTQASKNISILEAEKQEIEVTRNQEMFALNAKLAECMEELVGARSVIESQSGKLDSYLRDLLMLLKDEGLFSLMTEEFEKYNEGLRHMGILIQDLHLQFTEKGLHIHNASEHDFTILSSPLPRLEDFINDETSDRELSTEGLDDVTTLSKIVKGFHSQAKLLSGWFQSLSSYLDNYIAMTGQALQATSDEFIYMLELSESLKLKVNSLQEQNGAQEVKLSSLEKEMPALLSACQDAIQELQVDFSDPLMLEPEQDIIRSGMAASSTEAAIVRLQEGEAGEFAKLAEGLLLVSKKAGTQIKQLMDVNRVLVTSVDELKSKFEQAELSAEMAIQDRQLSEERLLKLEKDLEEMQNICTEMNDKIEENQAREDILRDREAELSSLQNALTSKDTGISGSLISESQVEVLLDKVNKMEISLHESTAQIQEVNFSGPVDKLFYVLENFTKLQQRLDSLSYEKEDMQLILESHLREMENLKKAAKTSHTDLQELESKKLDLIDLTIGLEKIIQRFGGNNLFEDQKPTASKGLLPVLERLMITSNTEVENLKSRLQELGAKLQAKEKVINELSAQNKLLEASIDAQLTQLDIVKERTVFDASTVAAGSEISEIEDVGPPAKNSISPAAGTVRTMRRGSNDHLVLSIDADTDPLVPPDIDDKGHVFKSLNTSGLIPRQGKLIADRVDGIWVSGGRILMNRPRARLGLIAYWIFLHLWLLGTIL